jgi:hypothetical protein
MRRSKRAIVTLALAAGMVSAAAGIASASKTMLDCLGDWDRANSACLINAGTEHMDTQADVERCRKRVANRLKICLANASDVPQGEFQPGTRVPPSKSGAFNSGILETGQFTPQGPAGTGSSVATPPRATAAPPSFR